MAYLMQVHEVNYDSALNLVRKARGMAYPNPGFQYQLKDYDGML